MSLYSDSDSEEDAAVQRTRRAYTPKEAWDRWLARRSEDDVEAIRAEVSVYLTETIRLQEAGDLFVQVQRARFCALPLLDEVVTEIAAELATELVAEFLATDAKSDQADDQQHDLR